MNSNRRTLLMTATIGTAAWIGAAVTVLILQDIGIAAFALFAIGILAMAFTAAITMRGRTKQQRTALLPLLITPAVVIAAMTPLFSIAAPIAFAVIAGVLGAMTVVFALIGSTQKA